MRRTVSTSVVVVPHVTGFQPPKRQPAASPAAARRTRRWWRRNTPRLAERSEVICASPVLEWPRARGWASSRHAAAQGARVASESLKRPERTSTARSSSGALHPRWRCRPRDRVRGGAACAVASKRTSADDRLASRGPNSSQRPRDLEVYSSCVARGRAVRRSRGRHPTRRARPVAAGSGCTSPCAIRTRAGTRRAVRRAHVKIPARAGSWPRHCGAQPISRPASFADVVPSAASCSATSSSTSSAAEAAPPAPLELLPVFPARAVPGRRAGGGDAPRGHPRGYSSRTRGRRARPARGVGARRLGEAAAGGRAAERRQAGAGGRRRAAKPSTGTVAASAATGAAQRRGPSLRRRQGGGRPPERRASAPPSPAATSGPAGCRAQAPARRTQRGGGARVAAKGRRQATVGGVRREHEHLAAAHGREGRIQSGGLAL